MNQFMDYRHFTNGYFSFSKLCLIGLLWLVPLVLTHSQPPTPTLPVETAPVKLDTVNEEVTAVGTFRAQESLVIRSEIAGRVLTIHFTETRPVEKGDLLVTLDPAEYKARLAESAAEVKLNELSYARLKNMLTKNLVSQQELDEAQAKLERSLAQQAVNQVRLEKTAIRAPFKGYVGLRDVSVGTYIDEGQSLVKLGDNSSVKLDFRIPEKFMPAIKFGQIVTVQVDAYPAKLFTGTLYASDIVIDEETRTLLLRALISNPRGELLTGMFCRVKLTLEKREQAMLIPEQAIVPKGKESFVFKIAGDKAILTKVILGQRRTGEVEVLSGLTLADHVVTAGQMKLYDGAVVHINNDKPLAKPSNG